MSSKRYILCLTLLLIAVGLTGCGLSKYVNEQSDPQSVLAFGYVKMVDSPIDVDFVDVRQVRPIDSKNTFRKFRADGNGLFYLENLPLGSYKLVNIGGKRWKFFPGNNWCFGQVIETIDFPGDLNKFPELAFRITKPGLYFIGSYQFERTEKNFFYADGYTFSRASAPTEQEALEMLLKYTKGTKWHSIISDRLKEIKK